MKKYLFEKYNQGYWEIDLTKMRLYNYHGGWHDIDENSEDWLEGKIIEADNWHDLYLLKGYNPLAGDYTSSEGWLDLDGNFWQGNGHSIIASEICELYYGLEMEEYAESFLVEHGWIKYTAWFMYDLYFQDGHYNFLTKEQYESFYDWCIYHHKTFPTDVVIRERNWFI